MFVLGITCHLINTYKTVVNPYRKYHPLALKELKKHAIFVFVFFYLSAADVDNALDLSDNHGLVLRRFLPENDAAGEG